MTIKADIVLDSVNPHGHRITTFRLKYPRFIHSEFLTHRDFSRNAASSRAVPIWDSVKLVWKDMAMPIHWGKKKRGMQADGEIGRKRREVAKFVWSFTGMLVSVMVLFLYMLGLHKQVANRMLEPWTHIEVIMTTTKLANWFTLRDHPDAQPEIQHLAYLMRKALEQSVPQQLTWNQWHAPYVEPDLFKKFGIRAALRISASCCAQVSFRKLDASLDKANNLVKRFLENDVVHASPFEHAAQACKDGGSGNFTGTNWYQLRHKLETEPDFIFGDLT